MRCPTSFWPPPNPSPSVKRGLRNTFGHFFTVSCTNQLSIWTWLFVSNRCSKSSWQEFWGTKLKKMPILTWKKVLQTIRANGQCPITKKFRKGLPLFCFPIDSIKQINLQRFSVVQGTMTQTFFKALHLTPIEENKAEPNICGIEEQNLEPYSHTK